MNFKKKTPFRNNEEIEENAGHQHLLLFHIIFYHYRDGRNLVILVEISSANALVQV